MGDSVVNAQERFAPPNAEWVVRIEVTPTWRLVRSFLRAVVTGKTLRITHTFDGNPFITGGNES